MIKTFTITDQERGILQITTDDERFYVREDRDPETGLPTHVYLPSVTWICNYAPKGIGFYKWLAEKGWDEAEAIKKERGRHGTRVHKAVEHLVNGEKVEISTEFPDGDGNMKALDAEEYMAVMSFVGWWKSICSTYKKIEVIEIEHSVWNAKERFAGTIDLILKLDDQYWIIDLKTSQYVWLSHEIQLSAYRHSVDLPCKTAILQLGYKRNKNNYKFTEVEDKWSKFLAAREFWLEEHDGTKPFQKDLPLALQLTMPETDPVPVEEVVTKKRAKK